MKNIHVRIQVVITLILISLLISCNKADPISITFGGDVILDRGVADKMNIHGDSLLDASMKPFFQSDFNVVNLETVLTKKTQSLGCDYCFRADPSIIHHLKKAKVTHASVANNHSLDFGMDGFKETVTLLNDNSIDVLGYNCNAQILIKGDQSVLVLAASLVTKNEHLCLKDQKLLLNKVKYLIEKHPQKPLILYLHWGLEYQKKSEDWQVEFAHKLIDIGVDAIIGHHPHVFQEVEIYNKKPIVYSLGNFVADAYLPHTTIGVLATLDIVDQRVALQVEPIDLKTYFPITIKSKRQREILLDNLNYSDDICYFHVADQWAVKCISDIDFLENTTEWIFKFDYDYQIIIKKLNTGSHKMSLFKDGKYLKSIALHGLLSEIQFADINNDQEMEILLGIAKKVNFDQANNKRLNIFKVVDGGFQTVWMGTKFMYKLESFDVSQNDHTVHLQTLERDSLDQQYNATYLWDEFGFALKTIYESHEQK